MKKFCIYLLCGLLTCSVLSTAYYRSAHAMEWVGGALAFEEALKWGLALLGITATAGMTNEYWENYGDDFTEYAIDNGATQQEVTEWQMKLCEGILDKGSSVWDKFKAWASSLVSGGSSGGNVVPGSTVSELTDYINNSYNTSFTVNNTYANTPVYGVVINLKSDNSIRTVYMLTENIDFNVSLVQGTTYAVKKNNSTILNFLSSSSTSGVMAQYYTNGGNISFDASSINSYIFSSNIINNSGLSITYSDIFGNSTTVDTNFESAFTSDIDNVDVISSVLPDEDDAEVSLPYPGVSDSDDTASADAYDDIIDAINDGTITQEQGIEKIQELLKVIVYDDVTDDVLPNKPDDDTGENKKKDDVINENKNNMGFSLAGLENVFPFCIPFDIYAFMTILVAEPVAPELDYPIQNVNGEVEEIHIDLSPFEPVAVVVRYVFDFLFIIGLGLLTRSLIGGGSSD